MNVCNYTQLTLIFTSVIHAMKRFKRVNKSDECFFWNVIQSPSERSTKKSELQEHLRALASVNWKKLVAGLRQEFNQ